MGRPFGSLHRQRLVSLLAAHLAHFSNVFFFPQTHCFPKPAAVPSASSSQATANHHAAATSALPLMVSAAPFAAPALTALTMAHGGLLQSRAHMDAFVDALPPSARPPTLAARMITPPARGASSARPLFSVLSGQVPAPSSPKRKPSAETGRRNEKNRNNNNADDNDAEVQRTVDALVCALSIRGALATHASRAWLNDCVLFGTCPSRSAFAVLSDDHCRRSVLLSLALEAELAVAERGAASVASAVMKRDATALRSVGLVAVSRGAQNGQPSSSSTSTVAAANPSSAADGNGTVLTFPLTHRPLSQEEGDADFIAHFLRRAVAFAALLTASRGGGPPKEKKKQNGGGSAHNGRERDAVQEDADVYVLCCAACDPIAVRRAPTDVAVAAADGNGSSASTHAARKAADAAKGPISIELPPLLTACMGEEEEEEGGAFDGRGGRGGARLAFCSHARAEVEFIFRERAHEPGDVGLQ